MCNNSKDVLLLLEEEFKSHTSEHEIKNLKKFQKEILNNYFEELRTINIKKNEYIPLESNNLSENLTQEKISKAHNLEEDERIQRLLLNWVLNILIKKCPKNYQKTKEELAEDMIAALKRLELLKDSFDAAIQNGISKESWFSKRIIDHISYMDQLETQKYIEKLNESLQNIENPLHEAAVIQTKILYQDHELDHFISEQYLINKFNHNFLKNGSFYRADLLKNDKNLKKKGASPVKIVLIDGHVNIIKCFYPKYCKSIAYEAKKIETNLKNVEHKKNYFENCGYPNMSSFSTKIAAPDGIISNFSMLLTDSNSEKLENTSHIKWNEYEKRTFLFQLAKSFFNMDVFSFIINKNNNFNYRNSSNSKKNKEKDYFNKLENSLLNESDLGIKLAVFASLLITSEKEEFTALPKGTNLNIIANIAFLSVENLKIFLKFCNKAPKDKERHIMKEIKNILGISMTNIATLPQLDCGLKENINIFLGPLEPSEESPKKKSGFSKLLKFIF